jgi:hypothetical protein
LIIPPQRLFGLAHLASHAGRQLVGKGRARLCQNGASPLIWMLGPDAIMNYRKIETSLAWFSIAGACLHFALETLYHFKFGQFLPFLIVDYIAVALLISSAVSSLRARPASSSGFLAGAWGFASCLAYTAFFAFVQLYLQGLGPMFMVLILGVALSAAFLAFALSLLLVKTTHKGA